MAKNASTSSMPQGLIPIEEGLKLEGYPLPGLRPVPQGLIPIEEGLKHVSKPLDKLFIYTPQGLIPIEEGLKHFYCIDR